MNSDQDRCRQFPLRRAGFAAALTDEPILIDGLRVVFDEKVALVPVTLVEPADPDELGD